MAYAPVCGAELTIVFTTKDTKQALSKAEGSTKFGLSPEGFRPQGGVLIFRTLRVLRDLRGK